ncbi:class F sortase [Amycolatopsis sp. NPDC059657]|uniref:class F sortase n=1 Tax=Amycolatopsis sp. NPDC059657 TaxID=3346899 RepID=UPI00366EFEDB
MKNFFRGKRGLLTLALVIFGALTFTLSGCASDTQAPQPVAAQQQDKQAAPEDGGGATGLAKSEPVSVDVPKIGAKSTLVPLGLNADNTVEVPPVSQPMQAGWYKNGPTPGEIGPAVILGHVDGNKQPGIFYKLKELAPGDKISVARKDGSTVEFVVTKVDQIAKDTFPTEAVYGDTEDAQLRLITCGGAFDKTAHSYKDNIIVYAKLA